jgi:hypothetical protein
MREVAANGLMPSTLEDAVHACPPDTKLPRECGGAEALLAQAPDLFSFDGRLATCVDASRLGRVDALQRAPPPEIGLKLGKERSIDKNALPAPVLVSIGCSVAPQVHTLLEQFVHDIG